VIHLRQGAVGSFPIEFDGPRRLEGSGAGDLHLLVLNAAGKTQGTPILAADGPRIEGGQGLGDRPEVTRDGDLGPPLLLVKLEVDLGKVGPVEGGDELGDDLEKGEPVPRSTLPALLGGFAPQKYGRKGYPYILCDTDHVSTHVEEGLTLPEATPCLPRPHVLK